MSYKITDETVERRNINKPFSLYQDEYGIDYKWMQTKNYIVFTTIIFIKSYNYIPITTLSMYCVIIYIYCSIIVLNLIRVSDELVFPIFSISISSVLIS